MKKIVLGKCLNTRDIGGYKTIYNNETKYNRIIRSDVPINIQKKDINYLKENNFTDIIDLRNNDECLKKVNGLKKIINYYNIEVRGRDCPNSEEDIPRTYLSIVDKYDDIYKICKIIINSKGHIIINCNLGKDRTGTIIMILLLNAGVSEEDIIDDYSLSYEYLKSYIEDFHKKNPNLPEFLGKSKKEYMQKTLALFKEKYSNINNYLKIIGLKEEEIITLKNKIIY